MKELKIVTGRERKAFVPEYSEEIRTFSASPPHVLLLHALEKGNISLDAIWQHEASSWTSQWDATQTLKFIPMLHFPGTAP